ncbi:MULTISPECIES: hypothetical protein [unclassified Sphingomonas]|uniref:hypothetical protein n=1 Tax=unclassified Sphingomonas TaxID=196159 RepID=UPI00226A8DA5|nr:MULTISPECIES: hypothetical protein [unclassified Sphingomonas]
MKTVLPLLIVLAAGFVQGPPWAHFSRSRTIDRVKEVVEIGSGKSNANGDFKYILKITRQRNGGKPAVRWTGSTACPVVSILVKNMTTIVMPKPAPYGVPGVSQDIVLDGSYYELNAPSTDVQGSFTISSNEGTSLSLWIDNSLNSLSSCWSASPPRQ